MDPEDIFGDAPEIGNAVAFIDHPSNLPGVISGEKSPGKIPREMVKINDVFPQPLDPHTRILRSSLYMLLGAIVLEVVDFFVAWLVSNVGERFSLLNESDDFLRFTIFMNHNQTCNHSRSLALVDKVYFG